MLGVWFWTHFCGVISCSLTLFTLDPESQPGAPPLAFEVPSVAAEMAQVGERIRLDSEARQRREHQALMDIMDSTRRTGGRVSRDQERVGIPIAVHGRGGMVGAGGGGRGGARGGSIAHLSTDGAVPGIVNYAYNDCTKH